MTSILRLVRFWSVLQAILFVTVTGLLNTTICLQFLSQSDLDLDYKLSKDEYLLFVQSISCTTIQGLSANQISIYQSLVCSACQSRGDGIDCCSDPNSNIPINNIDGTDCSEASSASFLCDMASVLVVGDTKPNCPPVETVSSSTTATNGTGTSNKQLDDSTRILTDAGIESSLISPKLQSEPMSETLYPSIADSTVYPTPNGQFEPLPSPTAIYPTPNGQLVPTISLETDTPASSLSPSPVDPASTETPSSPKPSVSFSDACYNALAKADANTDSLISRNEYIVFVAEWACEDANTLTDALSGSFDFLRYLFSFGGPQVNVFGVHLDFDSRSTFQQSRLDLVCTTTGSSLLLEGCPEPVETPPSLGVPSTTIVPTLGSITPPPTNPLPTLAPIQKIPVLVPTPIDIEPSPAPSEAIFSLPPYKFTTIGPTNFQSTDVCFTNLRASDKNNNGRLDESEYFDFLKRSATGNCSLIETLTPQQLLNMRTWCVEDGYEFCVTLPEISISGAGLNPSDQTLVQLKRLNQICNSVPSVCPAPMPTSDQTTPIAAQTPPTISPTTSIVVTSPPSSESEFELRICSTQLTNADQNGDNAIDETEYRTLLRLWIGCSTMDTMTPEQSSVFETLSCQCQGRTSASSCCASSPSQFPINLTRLYAGTTENDQNQWLTSLCAYIRLVAKPPCPQTKDYQWGTPNKTSMPPTVSPTIVDVNTIQTRVPTDIQRCSDTLVSADNDKNEWLNSYEFLDFITQYTRCDGLTALSPSQEDMFYHLACLCMNVTGASNKCCLPRNAQVDIDGARLLASARSQQQNESLALICDAAGEILSAGCISPLPQVPSLSQPSSQTDNSAGVPVTAPQSLPNFGAKPSTISLVSEQCVQNLRQSDMNKDSYINVTEYLLFLRLLGGCDLITSLSIQQETTLLLLAGAVEISPSTNFSIASALVPQNSRTYEQADFLSKVCLDSSLNGNCVESSTSPPLVVDDLNECLNALSRADSNDDKLLSIAEYLVFVRIFTNCSVFPSDRASIMYNAVLLSKQSLTTSQLNITGVGFSEEDLTNEQKSGLSQICLTTKQMAGQCISNPLSAPQEDVCPKNLVFADRNRDKKLDINEYLDFVRKQYNNCNVTYLPLSQRIVFQFLACLCLQKPGATWECCDPSNAAVSIDGASLNESNRTSEQRSLLSYICTSTKDAVETCPMSLQPALAVTKSHGGYVGSGVIKIFVVVLSVFFVWDR